LNLLRKCNIFVSASLLRAAIIAEYRMQRKITCRNGKIVLLHCDERKSLWHD